MDNFGPPFPSPQNTLHLLVALINGLLLQFSALPQSSALPPMLPAVWSLHRVPAWPQLSTVGLVGRAPPSWLVWCIYSGSGLSCRRAKGARLMQRSLALCRLQLPFLCESSLWQCASIYPRIRSAGPLAWLARNSSILGANCRALFFIHVLDHSYWVLKSLSAGKPGWWRQVLMRVAFSSFSCSSMNSICWSRLANKGQSSCCSHFRNMLSSRAADMPSKIGRTHGLVVEPRPRAHRKAKAKMSASTKQNSDKHISGAKATGVHQAFTNGYQGGPSSIL